MANDSLESSFKLQDRTALITGPCNTYNQAIALKLTQMGANVALIDRASDMHQRFANQLMDAREINERYGRAFAISADLSKQKDVLDGISRAAEAFGAIDIYIDGSMTTQTQKFKEANSLAEIDRIIDANLRGPLMMTHGMLRFLESRRRGRVIYLLHDVARLGLTGGSLMAAGRTGLAAFARTLAREVAENNITVNCVALGVTEEFLLSQYPGENLSIQESHKRLLQAQPFAPIVETEKIANVVAFLASPLGSGITGQTIAASQGMSYFS